ncbi:MAG: hypothetical protein M1296_02460 [Chloroflexi bacterium]|nr:hypothetical protein [Chloroflexota bacterium]
MRRRLLALGAALVWLFGLFAPMGGTAAAQSSPLDYPISNGHFYAEANGQGGAGGLGFAITNGGGIPFWTAFQHFGGVAGLGYPISGRFTWNGFIVQATQRVVMQWHPNTQQVDFVNVYDLLHDAGKDAWLQAYRNTPPPLSTAPDTGLTWNQVKARHLAFLNADPAIEAKYYSVAAYGDPVVLNGLPMTQVVDEGPFNVVRCQRVTIQHWLVNDPAAGAHAGDVTVTLGGDAAKAAGLLPQTPALQPAPAPGISSGGVPTSTPPIATDSQIPNFIYGYQAHMYFGQAAPALTAIQNAGFTWAKQQVVWSSIQPNSPNQSNWGELDTIVNTANQMNIKLMFSIVEAPAWARVGPDQPYPSNPQLLASFLSTLATRYKGKVAAYEIWNEENFAREVGPGDINPGNYVELLKAAYTAIKAVDPAAIVVSGAPTPTGVNDPNIAMDDNTYLQQMFAYQGGIVSNYFDVLGAHAEPWANPPNAWIGTPEPPNVTGYNNAPSFFFRRLENYRADMVAAGDGNKKIWETEFGYDSCPTPAPAVPNYEYCKWITEQQQAQYTVQAFQYARANYPWLGGIFIWNLNFQYFVPDTDEKWGFANLRADYSPRPVYTAVQQMPKI